MVGDILRAVAAEGAADDKGISVFLRIEAEEGVELIGVN